jgi:hypothetical protein
VFNYARDEHQTAIVIGNSVPDSYTSIPNPSASPISPSSNNELGLYNEAADVVSKAPKPLTGPAHMKTVFASSSLTLDLRYITDSELENIPTPSVSLKPLNLTNKEHKGFGVNADLFVEEGQVITFILRSLPEKGASNIGQPTRLQADRLRVPFKGEHKFEYSAFLLTF